MTLALYVIRRFIMNLFKVQIGILSLVLLITATEELQFLAGKNADLSTAFWLIGSRFPEQLGITFPLVILLGSLFTFLGLARSSELVVVRASGISAIRIILPLAVVATVIGIFSVAAFNPILAATIRKHEELRASFSKSGASQLSLSKDGIWLRQANEKSYLVIQAASSTGDGVNLSDVSLNEFALDGSLKRRIEAENAQLYPGNWQLTNATQWRFLDKNLKETSDVRPFRNMSIPTDLTSDKIVESFTSPEKMSIWRIPAFIIQLESSGFSAIPHRLFLQTQLSTPLLLVAMVLVGAVFALRPSRFGNTGLMALMAVLSGFLLYSLKNIAESLGEAQQIPIVLAAWAPATAALLFALALLLHLEDG